MTTRNAGILMPISSLPGRYGIGTFGESAYRFVEFLKKASQKYWQILPLGHTSFGDSPYQTFSAFAGNPYFIDLDYLRLDELLEQSEYEHLYHSTNQIDYGFLYENKYSVLRLAYSRFQKNHEYLEFVENEKEWLEDYALFMALKNYHNGSAWLNWEEKYKTKNEKALNKFKKNYVEEIEFWYFIQYYFDKQWKKLKNYANDNGIEIIGDIPIYVAMDSCDVWANKKYFQIGKDYVPVRVAGCPPDDFSEDGQLWGNPVYDYNELEKDGYSWWIKRMKKSLEMFDVVRIDHFRGFEAYWSIPYGDKTAKGGKWVKGPNVKLFKAMEKELGKMNIIAEDLGFLTEGVYKMIKKLKYPGMKILEFGFDPWGNSDHAPHNVVENSIVYSSSHDLAPLKEWYYTQSYENKRYILEYLHLNSEERIVEALIKCTLSTVAKTAIIPIQDYLELDWYARINTPSVAEGNWKWRAIENQLIDDLAYRISYWTKLYRR